MSQDITTYMQALASRLPGLVTCLRDLGHGFHRPNDALPGPSGRVPQQIKQLQGLVGAIPVSLLVFYRIVGSVDLTGSHPEWAGCEYADPLVVEPIDSAIEEALAYVELQDPKAEYSASESGIFRAPVAPDALHKANVSGGMWYGIEIPNAVADPIVLEEPHALPFTRYLEFSLSWGGFSGLANAPGHSWPLATLRRAAGAA